MQELQYPVRPGRYRHFKGNEYQVLGVARHSETEEEMVVYRALFGDARAHGRLPRALRGAGHLGAPRRHVAGNRDPGRRYPAPLYLYRGVMRPA